ncbi:hypothetical protein HanRHA438_Chr06g0281591 [Helianthus annuus]|nr:hypothetical protein HanRHA438_Chr06g0281591 [Helianthus annuus]
MFCNQKDSTIIFLVILTIGQNMSNAQLIFESKCMELNSINYVRKGFEDETSLRGVDL